MLGWAELHPRYAAEFIYRRTVDMDGFATGLRANTNSSQRHDINTKFQYGQ